MYKSTIVFFSYYVARSRAHARTQTMTEHDVSKCLCDKCSLERCLLFQEHVKTTTKNVESKCVCANCEKTRDARTCLNCYVCTNGEKKGPMCSTCLGKSTHRVLQTEVRQQLVLIDKKLVDLQNQLDDLRSILSNAGRELADDKASDNTNADY